MSPWVSASTFSSHLSLACLGPSPGGAGRPLPFQHTLASLLPPAPSQRFCWELAMHGGELVGCEGCLSAWQEGGHRPGLGDRRCLPLTLVFLTAGWGGWAERLVTVSHPSGVASLWSLQGLGSELLAGGLPCPLPWLQESWLSSAPLPPGVSSGPLPGSSPLLATAGVCGYCHPKPTCVRPRLANPLTPPIHGQDEAGPRSHHSPVVPSLALFIVMGQSA